MDIGMAVKMCRVARELSQQALANAAGVSVSYISFLERGKREPDFAFANKIAAALRISLPLLVFLAAEANEVASLPQDLREKMMAATLDLMRPEEGEQS